VGYRAHIMPTVSQSSTEGEFMAACSAGRMILFVRSILWDWYTTGRSYTPVLVRRGS
jgi:hypothetical protein